MFLDGCKSVFGPRISSGSSVETVTASTESCSGKGWSAEPVERDSTTACDLLVSSICAIVLRVCDVEGDAVGAGIRVNVDLGGNGGGVGFGTGEAGKSWFGGSGEPTSSVGIISSTLSYEVCSLTACGCTESDGARDAGSCPGAEGFFHSR